MSFGSKSAQYSQPIPGDVKGIRQQQIDLFSKLFSGQGNDALSSIFGPMGNPATPLQRQSTNQISQFLTQQAPEQRALEASMPMLQNILNSKPGAGIMDALQPHFQQNLAMANQEGGRFGSSNAILKGQAVNDYNLLGAQAAQQGQQTQLQAADAMRLLSGQAGQNPFERLMGGAGVGMNDANQADQGTQRMMQLMAMLMGGAQQAGFNVPFTQTKPATQGLGASLGGFLGSLFGGGGFSNPFGGGGGGGGGMGSYTGQGSGGGGMSPADLAALFG